MRSPVYPEVNLEPKEIEPGLMAYECPRSGGVWITLQAFEQWKAQQSSKTCAVSNHSPVAVDDSKLPALICPESGCVLLRYKVGHGLQFHVDRSPVTGGIWLDRGEWETLRQKGLHVDLNLIFTASYQRDVRAVEYAQSLEKAYRERIGEPDFGRVKDFKAWMTQHAQGNDILCYLSDRNDEKGGEKA